MPASKTRFIKKCAQWRPKSEADNIPHDRRGIYALLHSRLNSDIYDVVYIGMAAQGGIGGRLRSHRKSGTKIWTHFSVFEVRDNINDEEVGELEGLLREIYRKDPRANRFNTQKKCKKLRDVRQNDFSKW